MAANAANATANDDEDDNNDNEANGKGKPLSTHNIFMDIVIRLGSLTVETLTSHLLHL